MHALAHVPSARPILERLQQDLTARGERHATVQLLGQAEPHAFDLLTGIGFIDHGERQRDLRCAACPTGHGLRYAFYVTTTAGEVIGPVGSNCVFTRVLGEKAARSLGRKLEGGLAAFQREWHRQEQQRRLEEAGNWRSYLRGLGFDWVLLALAGEGHLPPELRATLEQVQAKNEPLDAATIKALRVLGEEKPDTPRLPRFTPASPSTFTASLAPSAAPMKLSRVRRFRAAAGSAMPPDEWRQYVARSRLKAALGNWEGVEARLPFDDQTRQDIKDALDHRRPLRLEHLEAVVKAGREAGMPKESAEPLPQVPAVMDWRALAWERERQLRTEELRDLDYASRQASGFSVLDVQEDAQVTAAKADWLALQHLLPAERQGEIRKALDTRFIRADDYAALMRAAALGRTPQDVPEYRTPEQFLTYVGVALRRARAFGPARQVHQLRAREALLHRLQPFLAPFVAGNAVQEGRLVQAVVTFFEERNRPRSPVSRPVRAALLQPASVHTVQLSQAERQAGVRLWTQGLRERLPGEHGPAIHRAVNEGRPLTPEQRDTLREALQALKTPPRVSLTRQEHERYLSAWGRGLAERLPAPDRQAIGRVLRQQGDLTAEQHRLLRDAQRQLDPQGDLTVQDRQRYMQAWGRGLANQVPPAQRKAISRALHQDGPLTADQSALLQDGFHRLVAARGQTTSAVRERPAQPPRKARR